jgi:hypothetical protein
MNSPFSSSQFSSSTTAVRDVFPCERRTTCPGQSQIVHAAENGLTMKQSWITVFDGSRTLIVRLQMPSYTLGYVLIDLYSKKKKYLLCKVQL